MTEHYPPHKLMELKSISAGYADTIVLQDIDLSIYERDFLGIIGPNGGGKTTLLRVILGLLKPLRGTISFYESNLQGTRKAMGYLPQFRIIDRHFPIRVMDVVLSGHMNPAGIFRRYSREQKEQASAILDRFGIYHLRDRAVGDLSGGQMQRVFLCRALVSSPGILILDEPDTFVDSSFSQDLNEILAELNNTLAIVLVSHDIGTILSSVKNIACVNGTLHYHSSSEFSQELMETYNCPVRIVGHGDMPHTILKKHGE